MSNINHKVVRISADNHNYITRFCNYGDTFDNGLTALIDRYKDLLAKSIKPIIKEKKKNVKRRK